MTERRIFFRSDEHLWHKNIIKYSNRPYKDVDDMNACLVENHNRIVQPNDVVIFGGDVSFRPYDECSNILESMNGTKILIHGNHDHGTMKKAGIWKLSTKRMEFSYGGMRVIVQHHPFELSSPQVDRENTLLIHGHTHGNMGRIHNDQIDISVECWEYSPVHIDTLIELFKNNRRQRFEHC